MTRLRRSLTWKLFKAQYSAIASSSSLSVDWAPGTELAEKLAGSVDKDDIVRYVSNRQKDLLNFVVF